VRSFPRQNDEPFSPASSLVSTLVLIYSSRKVRAWGRISMFLLLSLLYGSCNIYRSYIEKPYITPAGKSEGALALPDFVEANFRGSEAGRRSR